MGYVYSVDLDDENGPAVHSDSCAHWRGRNPAARTMCWHGPFRTYAAAVEGAEKSARACSTSPNPTCCHPRDLAVASGEDDPLQVVGLGIRNGAYLIDAIPDPANPTGGRWKRALMRLGKLYPSPRAATGIHFQLTLNELPSNPVGYLLETVDSGLAVLVEGQRWLGNARSGVAWWGASLCRNSKVGVELVPGGTALAPPSWAATKLLEIVAEGGEQYAASTALKLELGLRDIACIDGVAWAVQVRWGDRSLCIGDITRITSSISWALPATSGDFVGSGASRVRWISWQRGVRDLGRNDVAVEVWAGEPTLGRAPL